MNPHEESAALVPHKTGAVTLANWNEATNVAGLCKELVLASAVEISGRKYIQVQGWTSIAVAHGFITSTKPDSVQEVLRDGKVVGVKAVSQLVRQSDGKVIAESEGYVGDDELDWYGSKGEKIKRYSYKLKKEIEIVVPKRSDFAIRAMAQTRATSRLCKNAFSYIVMLIDKGLSTTPAEEIVDPEPGEEDLPHMPANPPAAHAGQNEKAEKRVEPDAPAQTAGRTSGQTEAPKNSPEVPRDEITLLEKQFEDGKWEKVLVHFGKNKGKSIGVDLAPNQLLWYAYTWEFTPGREPTDDDKLLRAALNVAIRERNLTAPAPRE